ncbi:hypothetical protein CgS9114_02243 [Corynebacterium glutamicum S9114]|nr:hypothetical protein CgS9114_02243 [Corynebacterium glutamicum S9114]
MSGGHISPWLIYSGDHFSRLLPLCWQQRLFIIAGCKTELIKRKASKIVLILSSDDTENKKEGNVKRKWESVLPKLSPI